MFHEQRLIQYIKALFLFLMVTVVFFFWNGTMTAIEVKDFVVVMVYAVIIALWLMVLLMKDTITIRKDPLFMLIAVYGLVLLCEYLNTNRCSFNYAMVMPPLCGIVTFLIISIFFTAADLPKLFGIGTAVAAFASIYGIMQYFNADPVRWIKADKFSSVISFFGHKNYFTLFLLLIIPCGSYCYLTARRLFTRVCALSAIALMLFALIISNSRGAIVILPVAVCISLVLYMRANGGFSRNKRKLYTAAGIILSAVLVVGVTLPEKNKLYFKNLIVNKDYDIRLSFYKAAGEIIASHPWFGVGPGNFFLAYPANMKYKTLTADPNQVLNHVHNDYLEIWVEYGLFALLLYLSIIVLLGLRIVRAVYGTTDHHRRLLLLSVLCGMLGYLAYSLSEVGARYMSSLFYFWLILAAGYLSVRESEKRYPVIAFTNRLKKHPLSLRLTTVAVFVVIGLFAMNEILYFGAAVNTGKASKLTIAGDLQGAEKILARAISLNKKTVEAFYQRGYVYFNLGQYEKALRDYHYVNRVAPGYVNCAFNLASCYYRQQDWVNAIHYAAVSHERFPDYEPNTVMLAFCYYYIQQPLKALNFCDTILKQNPAQEKINTLKKKLIAIIGQSQRGR